MLVRAVREGLGRVIVFADFITRPRKMQRDAAMQQVVEDKAANLALYQFYACPFCVRTRRALHRLNVPIETRDVHIPDYRQELNDEGGEVKVPCLRIEDQTGTRWMYESADIISWLEKEFGEAKPSTKTLN